MICRCVWNKRKNEYGDRLDNRRIRHESFVILMQCRSNRALVAWIDGGRDSARWIRRRWPDDERRSEWRSKRNVGRMLYQTGLPSLFRIRMRVRLTYSCTRTASRYPFYLPFSRSFPANTRSRTFPPRRVRRVCAYWRVDERWKREEGRSRVHVSALYACIQSRRRYNNVCAPAFRIDSSWHWSSILKRTHAYLHPVISRHLPLALFPRYPQVSIDH